MLKPLIAVFLMASATVVFADIGISVSAAGPFFYNDAKITTTWHTPVPCAAPIDGATLRLVADGTEVLRVGPILGSLCDGASSTQNLWGLPFGTYQVTAELQNSSGNSLARSSPVGVTILPNYVGSIPGRNTTLKLGVGDPAVPGLGGRCATVAARVAAVPEGMPAPASVSFPLGVISIDATNCDWHWLNFGPTPPLEQRILLESDDDLPANTVAWAFGPTSSDPTPHWYELVTAVSGKWAMFDIFDGLLGESPLVMYDGLHATVALGIPNASSPGIFQDIWWVGPQENGWGMTLTQHRDMLFGVLFIYDANGDARWLVIPGGQWNSAKNVFTGAVYRPKGPPYSACSTQPLYDASKFAIGPAIGSARLSALGPDSLTLDFTIDGISGSRQLQRLKFGPAYPFPVPRVDDLWWGGVTQNGWGLVVTQQYRSIFALWFTYDANGDAIWYAVPSATMTSSNTFGGPLYRPHGSPWLGSAYDATRQTMTPIGTVSFAGQIFGFNFSCTNDARVTQQLGGSRLPF